MLIYQLIYIILILVFFLTIRLKQKLFFYNIIIILLFIFSATRDGIGHDFFAYSNEIFGKVPLLSEVLEKGVINYKYIHGELGFLFTSTLLKTIGFDYKSIFTVMSFFTLVFLTKYFKDNFKNNMILPLYLYYSMYFISDVMGIIRYGLACAMLLYSTKYILNRNKYIFLSILILASLFHSSSIFFCLSYPIYKMKLKKMTLFIIPILSIIFSKFKLFNIFLIKSYNIYPQYIKNQINSYVLFNPNKDNVRFSLIQIYMIIMLIIFIFFSELIKKEKYNFYLKLYSLGICIYFIFSEIPTFSGRLSGIYLKADIFLYTYIFFYFKKKYIKILYIIFIIVLMTYFYENYIYYSSKVLFPYKSWLFD
ncbi:EpsG family protein [Cetobacterium sp.]|uniref:EpsG family protein n=1 Tax=Cetobacterium sp. TaxID=2071632 RepID=UPI003F403D46